MKKTVDFTCFSSIDLSEPSLLGKTAKSEVKLHKINGDVNKFTLIIKYEDNIQENHRQILRMAFIMPLLNYGLFSKKFNLDFALTNADVNLLNELNKVFSRDIFINKMLQRRANYILPKFILDEKNVKPEDANPKAKIRCAKTTQDEKVTKKMDISKCGVLSSGGKESLLTYGMLREIGCTVFPLYVNESGGHWRTALPAYKFHKEIDPKTQRIWTNVDRFYNFMLDNLKFIRNDHRKIRADTYPIRLCIFPYYVFALLPIFADNEIGNLLIGSEFDDLRNSPKYCGIKHYYGIYDQHQDYDIVMNKWYSKRIPGMIQWSAVRNISGLIVERTLVKRYLDLAEYQRSCHSCHFEKNAIISCGKCSKCMGVLLFLLANNADPKIMNFKEEDIQSFTERVKFSNLRLDQDEKDQSFYLLGRKDIFPNINPVNHVEKIHINHATCEPQYMPEQFRDELLKIIENYTTGYCILKDGKWSPMEKEERLTFKLPIV
jgi:hypothetical protein